MGDKERLRLLLGEHEPSKIRWRLADFYDTVITADMAETTRLGATIQTWWPRDPGRVDRAGRQRPH